MIKSSFLKGLLNNEEKNLAEYLVTWDDLNVFYKTINTSLDFITQIWNTEKEINRKNERKFKRDTYKYLGYRQDELCANLFNKFFEIFEVRGTIGEKISSQKELDDYCIELEKEAVKFQKKFSKDEDDIKTFKGNNFVDLRKYYLEMMVDKFKKMDEEEQGKVLNNMVQKLNTLTPEELKNFKDKMNITDITNESVKKILLGGGVYSMFAGAVGLIGFPAYLFLTSFIYGISSIIGITLPFGVYTGATSTMAFLSGWFLPIILAGGWVFSKKYTNKIRKIFAVASMVSISFQSYKDVELEKVNDLIDTFNYGEYDKYD
mgnify:CR=1 FL=1|jgi:hypothetical protein